MIRTTIVGYSGYSGAELIRLLSPRNDARVCQVIASSSDGNPVADLSPAFADTVELIYERFETARFENVDLVFVALASGESMRIVPDLLANVDPVIDLSGDFRLPSPELHSEFYGVEHAAPQLPGEAVYALPVN